MFRGAEPGHVWPVLRLLSLLASAATITLKPPAPTQQPPAPQGYVHRVYDDHITVFFPRELCRWACCWACCCCVRWAQLAMPPPPPPPRAVLTPPTTPCCPHNPDPLYHPPSDGGGV